MGLLRQMLAGPVAVNWTDDFWSNSKGSPSTSGLQVTPELAMSIGAVFACVRVLAETAASLPLIVYQRLDDGGKRRAREHPLYPVLHDQANRRQTAFQFIEMMTGHAALRGNAYAQIVPGPRGFADQLIPLHPNRIWLEWMPDESLRYHYTPLSGPERIFSEEEIFHLPTLSDNGVTGLSVITLARESLGLAKATEEYGARLFGQGATPRGSLTHPGKLSEPAKANLKESLQNQFAGLGNAHKTIVLEEGMKWEQIGLSNEDSQFLESRQFSVTEIARWFRVPPHMIGDLTRSTFSNIENESLNFVRFTMLPWFVRWEQAIRKGLILDTPGEEVFAEFLADALLRGDTAARGAYYQIAVTSGWMTRNEVRILENLNPLDGLDEPLTPQNITGKPTPALPAPTPNGQVRALALDAAGRVLRKEKAVISKAAVRLAGKPAKEFAAMLEQFYADHAEWVAKTLKISRVDAEQYCAEQLADLKAHGIKAAEGWLPARAEALVEIMLGEREGAHQ